MDNASHFEVILLVLVAFIEFIHINKVAMWFINRIFVVSLLLVVLVLLLLLYDYYYYYFCHCYDYFLLLM